MSFRFEKYVEEHVPLVLAMNERLVAGNAPMRFYESPHLSWLPDCGPDNAGVWRQPYVAVEDGTSVRGGYCIKPQLFAVNGDEQEIACWQGPISEGTVDKKYNMLGIAMLSHMQRDYPHLIGWGMSEQLAKIVEAMRWNVVRTSVFMYVNHPQCFLRQARMLRTSSKKRLILDTLAWTGVGSALITARRLSQRLRVKRRTLRHVVEPEFGQWADEIWTEAQSNYALIADRRSGPLNRIFPKDRWPNAVILRVIHDNQTIGWSALRIQKMADDGRFGNMAVGTIMDSLSRVGNECDVIEESIKYLKTLNVDVIVAYYVHAAWTNALRQTGFLEAKNRRFLTLSPKLEKRLGRPLNESLGTLHLTLADGDGPLGY